MSFLKFAGRFLIALACLHSLTNFLHLEALNQPWRVVVGVAIAWAVMTALPDYRDRAA